MNRERNNGMFRSAPKPPASSTAFRGLQNGFARPPICKSGNAVLRCLACARPPISTSCRGFRSGSRRKYRSSRVRLLDCADVQNSSEVSCLPPWAPPLREPTANKPSERAYSPPVKGRYQALLLPDTFAVILGEQAPCNVRLSLQERTWIRLFCTCFSARVSAPLSATIECKNMGYSDIPGLSDSRRRNE